MFLWGCNMANLVQKLLLRWGREIWLGQTLVRGILHHSGSKSLQNMQSAFSPLGQIPNGQYVYIGPANPCPEIGDRLVAGGLAYELRRVEQVRLGKAVLYTWGLCVEGGREQ